MISPTVRLTRHDNTAKFLKTLEALEKKDVLVGIPEQKNPRHGEPIGNAQLLYIQTNGSPVHNIPARPVIEPAIMATGNKDMIADKLKDAGASVLDGDEAGAVKFLKLAGTLATSLVKSWFTDPRNAWAPNKPETIKRKKSDRPLIDTGALRRAMTWVLREK